MNETEFRIDCDRMYIILTVNFQKFLRMMDPDNRDFVTSIETIDADGDIIPLMFFLRR